MDCTSCKKTLEVPWPKVNNHPRDPASQPRTNPLTRILNLFRKKELVPTEDERRRLCGYRAYEEGKELYYREGRSEEGKTARVERLQKALDFFDTAIDCGFEDEGVYADRGICLQQLGFDLDAIDDFDKAIASEQEDSNLYFMRSWSRSAVGDLPGHVSDLQTAIRVAAIDNAANRSHNAHACETGYTNCADVYRFHLEMAALDLKLQAIEENVRRNHPDLHLGPDRWSQRRAEAKRREQNEPTHR